MSEHGLGWNLAAAMAALAGTATSGVGKLRNLNTTLGLTQKPR